MAIVFETIKADRIILCVFCKKNNNTVMLIWLIIGWSKSIYFAVLSDREK